jgi:hypothetical protein
VCCMCSICRHVIDGKFHAACCRFHHSAAPAVQGKREKKRREKKKEVVHILPGYDLQGGEDALQSADDMPRVAPIHARQVQLCLHAA